MGAFVVYTLKVAVCLLVLYAFNKLVFSQDTFHRFNRWVWLLIVPVSLLLPQLNLKVWEMFPVSAETFSADGVGMDTEGAVAELVEAGSAAPDGRNPMAVAVLCCFCAWALGAAVVLTALAVSYIKMARVLHRRCGEKEEWNELLQRCCHSIGYTGKVHLRVISGEAAPFSWMNYIVLSEKDLREGGREILVHELAHIRERHSWDILLMDLLIVFQWFNPAAWLTKRSLQQVHEYTADEAVITSGIDAKQYQLLLIKKAVGQRLYSMTNSFNHSKLKNRITMMLKKKSSPWGYAKCLYALPIAFLAVSAFAAPKVSASLRELSDVKFTKNNLIQDIPDSLRLKSDTLDQVVVVRYGEDLSKGAIPYASIEQKPTFQGGDANAFSKWVSDNLQYPPAAKEAGISGRITYQFTIAEDGTLCNVKLLRGLKGKRELAALCEEEGRRVILSSPNWTPGIVEGKPVKVIFNFPIIFMLSGKGGEAYDGVKSDSGVTDKYSAAPYASKEAKGTVDKMPYFKGTVPGYDKEVDFGKWVATQLMYSDEAVKKGIQGRVIIKFTVGADGKVSDVTVEEGNYEVLNNEAVRVVNSSPLWGPAMKDGKPVDVTLVYPVVFQLR